MARRHLTPRRSTRGISTLEIIVGSAVSLLVLGGVYASLDAQTASFAARTAYMESQNATRTLTDLASRELRMATFDPTGMALVTTPGPACPGFKRGISEATPTRLRFQQDVNADGTIGGVHEDVTYELVDGTAQRSGGNAGPVTIASGLADEGLGFRYFDGSPLHTELVPSGTPPALSEAQRDCVARVLITARARTASLQAHGIEHVSVAQSEVAIRNRSLDHF